jgi:O-methyltransferase
MATQFGLLSKLNFLQDLASALIARVNPAIVHNLEKYNVLKKVHYLSAIEDIEGDYLEFGVFTGSSFCHSIRCTRNLLKMNKKIKSTKFYGFDSFSGFGELNSEDRHPFYTDGNFATSFAKVNRRVSEVAGRDFEFKLIPGFFSDTLQASASSLGISRSRIIFIDSDTYSSASEALEFCAPTVQEGTFIVLDDFFSYRGSERRGVARAFAEFVAANRLKTRQLFIYGMGGGVFVISEVEK